MVNQSAVKYGDANFQVRMIGMLKGLERLVNRWTRPTRNYFPTTYYVYSFRASRDSPEPLNNTHALEKPRDRMFSHHIPLKMTTKKWLKLSNVIMSVERMNPSSSAGHLVVYQGSELGTRIGHFVVMRWTSCRISSKLTTFTLRRMQYIDRQLNVALNWFTFCT